RGGSVCRKGLPEKVAGLEEGAAGLEKGVAAPPPCRLPRVTSLGDFPPGYFPMASRYGVGSTSSVDVGFHCALRSLSTSTARTPSAKFGSWRRMRPMAYSLRR